MLLSPPPTSTQGNYMEEEADSTKVTVGKESTAVEGTITIVSV